MKIVAKKDRKLLLINTGNTQNENKAETIELTVPEEYEDYNKKIVFVTDDGIVWDIIQDNTYKLTKAITKYKQVDFYIWLTKDDVDFRSKTMPLRFYHNEDASDEITPEEIHGVNTVVNILEEEITKVDSLETELRALITDIQNKLDNGEFDGEDGYTPQKGIDYFTEQDIEEIETDVKNDLEENVLVNYSLIAETGAKIELSINTTDYKLKAILKDKNNNIIHTSNVIDLPLETMVVNATYDNVNKAIILTLQNGTTVSISVADLVSGLVSESQLQTILSNYYTKIEINNLLNNKVDKVEGKGLSEEDFTNTLKQKLEGLENYDDTEIKADISDIQDEQIEQNTEIEKLQEENARLKATLPTTTGEGKEVTLNKTAELDFIKPPLPMGNSEQVQTTQSANLFDENYYNNNDLYSETVYKYAQTKIKGNGNLYIKAQLKNGKTAVSGLYACLCTERNPNISGAQYKMFVANGTANADVQNFTTGTDLYFCYYPTNITVNEIFENYNLWVSTSDISYVPFVPDSPTPDYPSPITNVTGDVEVKVQNKNLLPDDNFRFGYISNPNGVFVVDPYNIISDYIKIDNSKTYTISFNRNLSPMAISEFDKNKGFIRKRENYQSNISLTFSENTKYIIVGGSIGFTNMSKELWLSLEPQLEEGSTATPYTSHQEQTFTFPLGNEKLMLGDYLADDGIHHVREQLVLDGTENWRTDEDIVYITINNAKGNNSPTLSNFFKYTTVTNNTWGYIKFGTINKNLIFYKAIIEKESLEGFKEYLTQQYQDNSPIVIQYELEQEVIVPYTSAQQEVYNQIKQALSYEEQTNISSNQNALFSVEAYQSTKLILKEMATAIVALGGV